MPSLVESVIGVEEVIASLEDYANSARDFIRPLYNVKSLEMSVDTGVVRLEVFEMLCFSCIKFTILIE